METKPRDERKIFDTNLEYSYLQMISARTQLKVRMIRAGEPTNFLKRDFYESLIHLYGMGFQRLKQDKDAGVNNQLVKDMNAWDADRPTRNRENIEKGMRLSYRLQEALAEGGVIGQ